MRAEAFTAEAPGKLVPIVENGVELLAFVPQTLPRNLEIAGELTRLAEEASLHLGRLFGAGDILNPVLSLFLSREAIASNAIEGTITSARELYLFDAQQRGKSTADSLDQRVEVRNYILATSHGVDLMKDRPLSLNVFNELHKILLEGVRGEDKLPGSIRKRQNAISRGGFSDARYVPPPPSEVMPLMSDLETFVHEETRYPDLLRASLFHYQFEAIHPYLDGNGRLGRLLIPLLLQTWGKLPEGIPRLYLSKYFERHNQEYRDGLLSVSQTGDWAGWVSFFLSGVIEESKRTWDKAHELRRLRDNYIERVKTGPGNLQEIIRQLFVRPVIKVRDIVESTSVSRVQANTYAQRLVEADILVAEDKSWGRHFYADEILQLFFEESR
jgi:Fic family protein